MYKQIRVQLGAVQIHYYTSRGGGGLGPCKKGVRKNGGGGPDQSVILHHFFKRKFQQEVVRRGEVQKNTNKTKQNKKINANLSQSCKIVLWEHSHIS